MITARQTRLGLLPLMMGLLGCNDILGNTPPEHECDNGVQDGDETGVDCGGAHCAECECDPPCKPWARRFGDEANQFGRIVTTDGSDDVLVAGDFLCAIDFGGGLITGAGRDVFVAKLDPEGTHLWSKGFGDSGNHYLNAMTTNAAGDVLVTGEYTGSLDFGGGPLTSDQTRDIFLARLDANGEHLWSRRFGEAGDQYAWSVIFDGDGNILLAGSFTGTLDLDGSTLSAADGEQAFVAKLGPDGEHLWSKGFGGPTVDDSASVYALASDGEGNVLFTGEFYGTIDFGDGPVTSTNMGVDAFVVKLGPNGDPLWSKPFSGADPQGGYAIAAFSTGDVVVTGVMEGSADFGGGVLEAAGPDVFVVKLSAKGEHVWSKRFGDAADQEVRSLALREDRILLSGYQDGTVDFGGGPITTAGLEDVFLAELDATGKHVFSKGWGDSASQGAAGVAIDSFGATLLTGDFEGTIDFGSGPLTSAGKSDVFVARLPE